MKKLKGCTQTQCTEKKKKFKKDSERFCPSCGERLSFVCKQSKCFEEIDAACRGAYCPEHQAEHDEKAKKQRESKRFLPVLMKNKNNFILKKG